MGRCAANWTYPLFLAATALALAAGCGGQPSRPAGAKPARPSVAVVPDKAGPRDKLLPEDDENGLGANGANGHAAASPSGSPPSGPPHAERLAQADAMILQDRFAEAATVLEDVLAAGPGDAQRQQAVQLKAKLEDRRRAQAELRQLLPKLASQDRQEADSAQNRFFERADLSAAVLGEALRGDDVALSRAAIETLARLRRPQEAAPLLVEVLRRPGQKALWPDAARAMDGAGAPGAGAPLLDLATSSQDPQQRTAALGALARAADPPRAAAASLLPWVYRDGPELPAALEALARTGEVHRLHDVATRRGWDMDLSPEAQKQLDDLPGRIAQLLQSASPETAAAARRLAILTRQVPAGPLPGVKVLAFSAEQEDGKAGAVLDGQWNTTDGTKMWRYPAARPGSIVLDLGQTRTVCGVRIWNLNEPGAPQRGWKEVAVYTGDSPTALVAPAATGQLAPSPGAADVPDYSITVPVDFRRGRYVRLRAASTWSQDATSGLAEVQVLGY